METFSLGSQVDTRTIINVSTTFPTTIPANSELVISPGTYNIASTIQLNSSTIRSSEPTTQQAVILNWVGSPNSSVIELSGNYPIVQRIQFVGDSAAQAIFCNQGTTNVVIDGSGELSNGPQSFVNFGEPFSPNTALLNNCWTTDIGAYSIFVGGNDIGIINSQFYNSKSEHLIRGTCDRLTIDGGTLVNYQGGVVDTNKDAISPQGGSYWSICNTTIGVGGPITFGPILTNTAVNPPVIINSIVRNCNLSVPVNIDPGTSGILIDHNNIITSPNGLNITGQNTNFPYLSINNLTFSNNIVVNNGTTGSMFKGFAGALSDVAQIKNNNYTQDNVVIGPTNYFSASVTILDKTEGSYNFSGNVYGKPEYYSYQLPQVPPFHSFCVGGIVGPNNFVVCPSSDIQN